MLLILVGQLNLLIGQLLLGYQPEVNKQLLDLLEAVANEDALAQEDLEQLLPQLGWFLSKFNDLLLLCELIRVD